MEQNGIDFIEIGLPFSDPLADGPTIQASSTLALNNGMTTALLFDQLKHIRESVSIPLIIMGYFNPIMQYGIEKFCEQCEAVGIDGLIIPDLPVLEYITHYQNIFKTHNLFNIFLITPQTSVERIHYIDSISEGFIYMVSSASVTGAQNEFGSQQMNYFKRIAEMGLRTPLVVGFGISNNKTFEQATTYAKGAIIGSACIKQLERHGIQGIPEFVKNIR
jgi:tryptophan synthase alpha chain